MIYILDFIAVHWIGIALFILAFNGCNFVWRMSLQKQMGNARVAVLLVSEEGKQLLKSAVAPESLLLLGSVCIVLLFLAANMGFMHTRSGNSIPSFLSWGGMFTGCTLVLYHIRALFMIGAALWIGKMRHSD